MKGEMKRGWTKKMSVEDVDEKVDEATSDAISRKEADEKYATKEELRDGLAALKKKINDLANKLKHHVSFYFKHI